MGFLADLNERISANLQRHGRALAGGELDNRRDDACHALAQFAAPDRRDAVRRRLERIMRANAPRRRWP